MRQERRERYWRPLLFIFSTLYALKNLGARSLDARKSFYQLRFNLFLRIRSAAVCHAKR
jgi:hypothetical protein